MSKKHNTTLHLLNGQVVGPPLPVLLEKKEHIMLCQRVLKTNNLFKGMGFRVESAKPATFSLTKVIPDDLEEERAMINLTISFDETTNTIQNTIDCIISMLGYTPFEDIYGLIKMEDTGYALYYNLIPM
jgi:hypothetical protein